MLRLENIGFSYGTGETLRDISFGLQPGEVVSVLGMNGSGKSTLLKAITGIIKPHTGTVLINMKPLTSMTRREAAMTIGYMPQKSNGVNCTVFDAVLLGRKPHIGWEASQKDIDVAGRILRMMGLEQYAFRLTTELSGGELQKVVIARALAQEPRILLLDEPISHLDMRNQMETMALIRKITIELNIVTIAVLHDLSCSLRFSDRFVLLRKGRLHSCGDISVMTPQTVREVFGMEAVITEVNGIPAVVPVAACG